MPGWMHAPDPHALSLALAELGASPDEPVQVRSSEGAFLVRVPRLGATLRLAAPAHGAMFTLARA